MNESFVTPGTILLGKFRVERVLGQGAMGIVVAATHIQLEEKVAIKFLRPDSISRSDAVQRFVREARAAAKLQSEHVAKVSDVGTFENGAPYMVMEYLEGSDLEQVMHNQRQLSLPEVVDYVLQTCEAIAEAHSLGIVHRDLKLSNLFLIRMRDGSPCIKVLDFGISKLMTPGGGNEMTKTTGILGSPLYMSPEQLSASANVDARSDVWSLGVVAYELIAGINPFMGEDLPQVCTAIMQREPMPLTQLRADVPPALDIAIRRCLVKNRDQRYASIADFVQDIAAFAPTATAAVSAVRAQSLIRGAMVQTGSNPSIALQHLGTSSPTFSPLLSTSDPTHPAAKPSSSGLSFAIVAAALLIGGVGAGLGIYAYISHHSDPPKTVTPASAPVFGATTSPSTTSQNADKVADSATTLTIASTPTSTSVLHSTPTLVPLTTVPVTQRTSNTAVTPIVPTTATRQTVVRSTKGPVGMSDDR